MKKIIALLLAVVLCMSLCGCGGEKKAYRVATQNVIDPIAEKYGIDMKVVDAYGIYKFESKKFAALSPEDKMSFFDDVVASGKIPLEGCLEEYFVIVPSFVDIYSDGKEYRYDDSQYDKWLYEDDKLIYSVNIKPYIPKDDDNNKGDGKNTCKRCGTSSANLTAGGYCKVCVETYYTDYYIGLDGQVTNDLPY